MYGDSSNKEVHPPSASMPSFSKLIKIKSVLSGATLSLGSVTCAQIIARAGFDWVLIDMEHAPTSAREATSVAHAVVAASSGQCLPIIRTPSHGVEWIKWALDSGAAGIIVPMVNSAAEAEAIVQRATYPPAGQRSFGPFLAQYADTDSSTDVGRYLTSRAPELSIIVMIESVQGVRNAEAILSVKGLTGCFIGPFDLRQSMGLSGGDGDEPEFIEALETVVRACKRCNLHVGTVGWTEEASKRKTEMGFNFLLNGSDSSFLNTGARSCWQMCNQALRETKRGKL